MKTLKLFLMIAAVAAAMPAMAAEEWGLPDEKKARFEAKVVDVLCELTGNCPANCGDGKRQLGLIDKAGKLVLPFKNATPFAGAAADLKDFCGRKVIADGLFTTGQGYRIFALQYVREAPSGKWRRANRFIRHWARRFGFAANGPEAKRWFEHDPRVKTLIGEQGQLGLGLEADRTYFSRNK